MDDGHKAQDAEGHIGEPERRLGDCRRQLEALRERRQLYSPVVKQAS